MSKASGSFDDFLIEISASLSGNSGEAALRRINAERKLKLVLDNIVEQRYDVQIRVLNDSRIAGESGADILIQIDDYDVRLEILDAPKNKISLDSNQINLFKSIFEDNPSTETLVITWTTEDLNSIQLTLNQIDQLAVHPDQIQGLINSTRTLAEVINDILENRIKVWGKMLATPQEKGGSVSDIRNLFEGYFRVCLEEERSHSFKLVERKAAAAILSEKNAVALFNSVLDQALTGEDTETLVKSLSQLPERSGK